MLKMPKIQKVGGNFLVNNGNEVFFSGVSTYCMGFESPIIWLDNKYFNESQK